MYYTVSIMFYMSRLLQSWTHSCTLQRNSPFTSTEKLCGDGIYTGDFSYQAPVQRKWPAKTQVFKDKALFRCEKILDFATVTLSFVCGKYYSIID